jgi:predicted flap endonuclease-1-like 5' DNA nuclease
MSMMLNKLFGMNDDVEGRLRARGIKYTDDLLTACRNAKSLAELAEAVQVDKAYLKRMVQRADLERIRGIGDAYIALLEEAGVRSAADLAAAAPDELRGRLTQVNAEKRLVGRIPAPAMVNGWVKRAQYLTRD